MAKILQPIDGVLVINILVNGKKIKDTIEVMNVSIQMEMNKITIATLTILDGAAFGLTNEPFSNSESDDFKPGNEIEIKIGYEAKTSTVFKGIITALGVTLKGGNAHLTVTCKDKAVKMTKGRFNAIFEKSKDSDAIREIAGKYGLSAEVASTSEQFSVLMQYNCSDWDYVLIRAELNNLFVITNQNKLSVKEFNFSTSPNVEINATQYVIDIDLNVDGENIASAYKLTSWDTSTQKVINATKEISDLSIGNISAKILSDVADNGGSEHYSSASLSQTELKAWGDALNNKALLSKVQGKIVVPGTSEIISGDMVKLSGLSARFNGNAFVSKVIHTLEEGEWITTLHVGRAPQWHSSLPDVEENNASGIIPGVQGTQIGTVKKIDSDPDGKFRVLVSLPSFTGTNQETGIWARIAFPYATKDAGFFFYPEIGDEVLLTFINNDPRFPVISGVLYSEKNTPKNTPDDKNQFKAIHTKSGIFIQFDDDKKILTIETPGKNSIVLDDDGKKISLSDMNQNTVTMSDSGIALDSPKDITISADGKVSVSGTQGVNIESTQDVTAKGLNVELSANVGATVKGTASAELSASGQTTVKGAMVMIN